MKRSRRLAALVAAGLLASLVTALTIGPAPAAKPRGGADGSLSSTTSVVRPDRTVAGPQRISRAAREQAQSRLLARREAAAEAGGGGGASGASNSPEVSSIDPDLSESLFTIRNTRNTRAQVVSGTVAEPAAADDANEVAYWGNTYFSRSSDNGVTWTGETIPAGPAATPTACCDPDLVRKPNLDTTFGVLLYINSAATDGAVRIFVRRSNISGGADCSYTFETTGAVLPDYPHLGVSNGFLYLTTNQLGTSWQGAQIRRFNATQMANCQATTTNTVTYTGPDGQRILTPVEGATSNMYFGLNRTSTLFRILQWPESSTTISQFDRTLSHGSVFANPDCRGGTGNFDFIERSTSWSISGFRLRGAVVPGSRLWFMWNVASDSSHTQAHVHSALFTEPGLAALTPTHLFNNSTPFCIGYPTLSSNSSGFFGLTVAAGGRAGGGGRAAEGYVSVDDNNTTGNSFAVLTKTALGTHNRSDNRYGDYFTIRKSAHCPTGWVATNYSLLNGNTSPSHVNARYVELASNNNTGC